MRIHALYCIKGNETLLALAEKDDIFELLAEPIAVDSPEGACRDPWTSDDYINRVKLYYVMRIYDEYSHHEVISDFIQKEGLKYQFFDKYWEIIPLEDVEHLPSYGEKFKGTGKLKRKDISPTGCELLDGWLDSTVDF